MAMHTQVHSTYYMVLHITWYDSIYRREVYRN